MDGVFAPILNGTVVKADARRFSLILLSLGSAGKVCARNQTVKEPLSSNTVRTFRSFRFYAGAPPSNQGSCR